MAACRLDALGNLAAIVIKSMAFPGLCTTCVYEFMSYDMNYIGSQHLK